MTRTENWLGQRRADFLRREVVSSTVFTVGALLACLALGVGAARLGIYQKMPVAVFGPWLAVVASVWWGVIRHRRRVKAVQTKALAWAIEATPGVRRGSVLGLAGRPRQGSEVLLASADEQISTWLEHHGDGALAPTRRWSRKSAGWAAAVGGIGALVFVLAGPGTSDGAAFWRPTSLFALSRGSLALEVDREDIKRGERVMATITATGETTVELWSRSAGEPWDVASIPLDSAGEGVVPLGPLDADMFLRAVKGRRESETIHVVVSVPAFLVDLAFTARFPRYLDRIDEPLVRGDSVSIPAGTRIVTAGRATVPVRSANWRVGDNTHELVADGPGFSGEVAVGRSGQWLLEIVPEPGHVWDDVPPQLFITVVSDSGPSVEIPVPGVDTVAHTSLRQPIIVDVRDDHRVTRVEVIGRRAEQAGRPGEVWVDTLAITEGGEQAVLPWVVDLNDRGFSPGDTAFYRARAYDNAPTSQMSETREFALRLPSVSELRQAIRDAGASLVADADSLAQAQRELTQTTEDLESARNRDEADGLEFREAERAGEIGEEQAALLERAEEMAKALEEMAQSGWEAGITDPEWHKQMAELQELLEDAITPEMRDALEELQNALERLDPQSVQEALERLSESQQQMQEQLERSQELLERAALESSMTSLAEDVEDLADEQEAWNREAESSAQSDSALADAEAELAERLDELQKQMQGLEQPMQQQNAGDPQAAQQQMSQASQSMEQAADAAQQGDRQEAQQQGENASEQLSPLSEDLREQLEEMREDWREEVLGEMDQALTETAELARRQERLMRRMERGESGENVRGEQAAVRQSVDRVIERLQDAAGKNALVSPNLSTALGFSRLRMSEALSQFEQTTPNTRQAAELAAQAVDGLNAVASALLRNRSDVEGSSSGSGMAEAMQQMAEMASQQEAVNGQTSGILPMMPQGGEQLLQQLQEIAQQERDIAEELERMGAEEVLPAETEELAEQAKEVARELEAGRIDQETLRRQEDLFRKLLDAGRSLRSDEEDEERKERESETGRQDLDRSPEAGGPGALRGGVRYPYPDWDQLSRFTAEERRLILNYFRRLNAGRP